MSYREKNAVLAPLGEPLRHVFLRAALVCCAAIVAEGGSVSKGNQLQPLPPPATAAEPAADQLPFSSQYQGEYFTSDLKEVFRLRHIEGEGQGGVDAYTSFGFSKFVWTGDGILMFDIGGRVTNDAEPGVTGGIHRRVFVGNMLVGTGIFYDWQEFNQGSLALELFNGPWALRANGYAIFGDDVESESEFTTTATTNIFFQGNFLMADNLQLIEEYDVAMSGADIELARSIGMPTLEAFIGGYFYSGDLGDDAVGGKGGLRGFITPDLAGTIAVAGDDLFGTNLYGGLTWFLGAKGGLSRPNMARRLLMPVERNEQIVVSEVERTSDVAGPVVLMHEDDEIEIIHVEEGAAGLADGTFENPFNALPATEEADIVYVYADGVFVGQSYTLAEDQRFLGEGNGAVHLVETDQLGDIVLPDGNGGVNRPVIQAAPGNAITIIAQDSEVSNFGIENAVGHGIFGSGITDFNINRNVITGSGGRGIFLNNVSGAVDGELFAEGEIRDNVVDNSTLQNIQVVLASDFRGDITGNTADLSSTSQGIEVSGAFVFTGDVANNTANDNFTDGIRISVDEFIGDIEGNTANNNGGDGILLAFDIFDGDVSGNTTNGNGDNGIDMTIGGDGFSEVEIEGNTLTGNGAEGMYLLFSATGTADVDVLNNNFSNNNGGVGREFFAENEDAPGNAPTTYIGLDGNTSTNALGVGPPFNYEFDNNDVFADGRMFLDLGTNVGTVENDEDVEPGDFPF
jgi:hypothetical protein